MKADSIIDVTSRDPITKSKSVALKQDDEFGLKKAIEYGTVSLEDDARKQLTERYATTTNSADERISKAIEALEDGRQVIHIGQALGYGFIPGQLPQLAISPAGLPYVYAQIANGVIKFSGRKWYKEYSYPTKNGDTRVISGRTILPFIPPDIRPTEKVKDLNKYRVIWQVPTWRDIRVTKPEPIEVDPVLIEPISGQLGLVIAMWDLTSFEMAALTD